MGHFIDEEYKKQPESNLIHPLYNTSKRNIKREWNWFGQAEILYKHLNKKISCKAKKNLRMFDLKTKKETFFDDDVWVELYEPTEDTIPIKKKKRLKEMILENFHG